MYMVDASDVLIMLKHALMWHRIRNLILVFAYLRKAAYKSSTNITII